MKALPQSLHDRAELLARSHPLSTVAQILGVRPNTISVMRKRGWKACELDPRLRPVPTDWQIQARHMKHAELCEHYGAGTVTVSRWLREHPIRDAFRPGPRRKP
jgi:uncharacterized protein YjcR